MPKDQTVAAAFVESLRRARREICFRRAERRLVDYMEALRQADGIDSS